MRARSIVVGNQVDPSRGLAAALHYADSGRRSWLLLAGVLGAIACLFKQTGIVSLVAIAAWLVTRRTWRDALALSGAAAVVVLARAALFARLGALPDMVQQVVLWNGSYVASPGLAGLALGGARFFQYYYVAIVPPLAVCGGYRRVLTTSTAADATGKGG